MERGVRVSAPLGFTVACTSSLSVVARWEKRYALFGFCLLPDACCQEKSIWNCSESLTVVRPTVAVTSLLYWEFCRWSGVCFEPTSEIAGVVNEVSHCPRHSLSSPEKRKERKKPLSFSPFFKRTRARARTHTHTHTHTHTYTHTKRGRDGGRLFNKLSSGF